MAGPGFGDDSDLFPESGEGTPYNTHPAAWDDGGPEGLFASQGAWPGGIAGGEGAYRKAMRGAYAAERAQAGKMYRNQSYTGDVAGRRMAGDAIRGSLSQQGTGALGLRRAIGASGQGQLAGYGQGAEMATKERLGRDAQLLATMEKRAQYEQMMRDDATTRGQAQLQADIAREQQRMALDEGERQFTTQVVGGVLGAAGAGAGAVGNAAGGEPSRDFPGSSGYTGGGDAGSPPHESSDRYWAPEDWDTYSDARMKRAYYPSDQRSKMAAFQAGQMSRGPQVAQQPGAMPGPTGQGYGPTLGAAPRRPMMQLSDAKAKEEAYERGHKAGVATVAPPIRHPWSPYGGPDPSRERAALAKPASFETTASKRETPVVMPPSDLAKMTAGLSGADRRRVYQAYNAARMGRGSAGQFGAYSANPARKGGVRPTHPGIMRLPLGRPMGPDETLPPWLGGPRTPQQRSVARLPSDAMTLSDRAAKQSAYLKGKAEERAKYLGAQLEAEGARTEELLGRRRSPDEQAASIGAELDVENAKTMRSLQPFAYTYKPEAQAKLGVTNRPQVGPTAQNLEQTPVGKTVVYDTPDGKMIDVPAATMQHYSMLSALQRQNDQQQRQLDKLYATPIYE